MRVILKLFFYLSYLGNFLMGMFVLPFYPLVLGLAYGLAGLSFSSFLDRLRAAHRTSVIAWKQTFLCGSSEIERTIEKYEEWRLLKISQEKKQ